MLECLNPECMNKPLLDYSRIQNLGIQAFFELSMKYLDYTL